MSDVSKKCEWLFYELIKDEPRTVFHLAKSTGIDRRIVDDSVYALIQQGKVRILNDSRLEACE